MNPKSERGDFTSISLKPIPAAESMTSGRTGSATPIGSINTLDQRHNEVDLKTSTVGNHDVEDAAAEREISVVGWDSETDSENPLNWPKKRKLLISLTSCLQAVQCTLCASIFTPGVKEITRDLKTSNELALTALTFYVMGFALGPLVWSPMSEVYGRNYVYHRTWPIFTVIQIGCALAPNIATLLVCRFIAGFTGGTAVTIPAGGMADIWTSDEIGPPIGMFLMQAYLGPIIGPLIGGYLVQYASWRWTFWLCLINCFVLGLNFLWYPETFAPILLERKAKRLREQQPKTDTTRILAPNEVHKKSKAEVFRAAIWRPWRLLFLEPIVFLVALYISFVNGVLHLYFAAYPIVYRGLYHWDVGNAGLPFIGLAVGILLGGVVAKHMNQVHIRLKTDYVTKTGSTIYPEGRLPYAIIASFLVPGSMFWFAWSGDGKTHWIVSILSGIPFGWGLLMILLCLFAYITDAYLAHAASVLAAVTLMRSTFAGAFPLFADRMYMEMTPKWAGTLLACVSILFIPVPFLFFKYGPWIRSKSLYTFKDV